MFWDIIRDSAKLGTKSGALLGGLYFPVFWLLAGPTLTLIQTGHLPESHGNGSGMIPAALLGLLIGGLFGTLLGSLNGLFLAVLTASKPQNYLSLHWRQLAAACAVLNLCGLTSLMLLMFLTDFFTDFNFSAHRLPHPKWVTDIYSDWPSFFALIGAPALLAAGAAVWAMVRMAKWYQEAAPPDAGAPTLADDL